MSESRTEAPSPPPGMPEDVPPIEAPPAIPGLGFRGLRRPADYEILAELGNLAAAADDVAERNTADELRNWLEHDPRRDLERDVVVAEIDGQAVAFGIGGWELDNDGGHDYGTWGAVHPDWRRRGLGTALLGWVEARQRQLAATHPAEVAKRLESWSYAQEIGRNTLLERHGYAPVRFWFEMERPDLEGIPEAPLADGYRLRDPLTADPREVWNVVVAAFKDHFGAMDDSEEAFEGHLNDPNRDPSLWVLVEHEGRIVGTALNRINRPENAALGVRRGRVNAVAVLRGHRRRGLGRAITAESLRVLRRAGMSAARLGVDAENPHGALGIYESLGFGIVERGRIYRKQLRLD